MVLGGFRSFHVLVTTNKRRQKGNVKIHQHFWITLCNLLSNTNGTMWTDWQRGFHWMVILKTIGFCSQTQKLETSYTRLKNATEIQFLKLRSSCHVTVLLSPYMILSCILGWQYYSVLSYAPAINSSNIDSGVCSFISDQA